MKSLVLFPYTFTLMNWAAIVGLYRFARGRRDIWSGCEVTAVMPRGKPGQVSDHDNARFSDAA
jgi:hypothetical protein